MARKSKEVDMGGIAEEQIVKTLRYHIMQFGQQFLIPKDMIEVKEYPVQMAEGIVADIQAKVYGRDLESVQFPFDWKESLKQKFFPKWLQKYFPVKYTTIKVSAFLPLRETKEEVIALRVMEAK